MYVDAHFHLCDDDWKGDVLNPNDMIENAINAGLKYMLLIGADKSDWQRAKQVSEKFENVFLSVGIHPHYCENIDVKKLKDDIISFAKGCGKIVALGEFGLDYAFGQENKKLQKDVFKIQLEACLELELPAVIHCREADIDAYPILKQFAEDGGKAQIHCYTGDCEYAKKYVELGFIVSSTAIPTFKNGTEIKNVFKTSVPVNQFLTETDAPYCAPAPFRGKTNQPAYVKYIAKFFASLYEMEQEDFDKQIIRNFENFFLKK